MTGGELGATVSELGVVAMIAMSHMAGPNHWLPYALMGAAQQWGVRRTVLVTFAGATGHVMTTILAVVAISRLGGSFLSHDMYKLLITLFLSTIGVYYLYSYFVNRRRDSCCDSSKPNDDSANDSLLPLKKSPSKIKGVNKSTMADGTAALSLIAMTSLSPCMGSMPVLLAYLKPPFTFDRVLLASAVLLTASAGVMCGLVALFLAGAKRIDFGRVRRHERLFLGISFVFLAALTFFLLSRHEALEHHHDHLPHDAVMRQATSGAKNGAGFLKRKGCGCKH